ncbi:MAG: transposase [Chloroflexi bacterium]|nr:transposase [Chloroflexota bacterium]
MKEDLPNLPQRRSIRLKEYDYSQAGAYFVTICSEGRQCLFGSVADYEMILNEFGALVASSWQWLATQYSYVLLDEWVVMPNHLHGILVITDRDAGASPAAGASRSAPTGKIKSLGSLIGAFKTVSTKHINKMRKTPGATIWQRNYYEHIVRDEDEMAKIREYIANNPARWGEDKYNPVGAVREPPATLVNRLPRS